MCKVYNQIGCLTAIKSHLRQHHINEYKSVKELINFQNNYSVAREEIITNHTHLIDQEKDNLSIQIVQLDDAINAKKNKIEERLLADIEKLKYQLNSLPTSHPNIIQGFINYLKKIYFTLAIQVNKFTFHYKITSALKPLMDDYKTANTRHTYITLHFNDAVTESYSSQLREIDRKKVIIDEINSTIYGALGEQKVVKELGKLSDDHILINDFACRFDPPIYYQQNDYIRSIQIDHILVSQVGVFLIETKNWSRQSVNNLSLRSPIDQIKRTRHALNKMFNKGISDNYLRLNKHHWGDRKIPIKNLIVMMDHKPREQFQYVKVLTLNELIDYVNYLEPCFSIHETQTIANYLLKVIEK